MLPGRIPASSPCFPPSAPSSHLHHALARRRLPSTKSDPILSSHPHKRGGEADADLTAREDGDKDEGDLLESFQQTQGTIKDGQSG
ncbi:hypothetical protein EJB05_14739, partial [Eragrostis curvula]